MFFIKNKTSVFFLIILFLGGFIYFWQSTTVSAASNIKTQFENSLQETGNGAGYPNAETAAYASKTYSEKSLTNKVGTLISEALSFLGVIFLILMIYGGYVWMKARGNEADVKRARDIIIDALIGLLIVAAAYAISYFVVGSMLDATTSVIP